MIDHHEGRPTTRTIVFRCDLEEGPKRRWHGDDNGRTGRNPMFQRRLLVLGAQ